MGYLAFCVAWPYRIRLHPAPPHAPGPGLRCPHRRADPNIGVCREASGPIRTFWSFAGARSTSDGPPLSGLRARGTLPATVDRQPRPASRDSDHNLGQPTRPRGRPEPAAWEHVSPWSSAAHVTACRNATVAGLSASRRVSAAVSQATSAASRRHEADAGAREALRHALGQQRHAGARRDRKEDVLHAGLRHLTTSGTAPRRGTSRRPALANGGLTCRGSTTSRSGASRSNVTGASTARGCVTGRTATGRCPLAA